MSRRRNDTWLATLLLVVILYGCKPNSDPPHAPVPPRHPEMCTLKELPNAADLAETPARIPNNQYVSINGMSNPQTIVWHDAGTDQLRYITKLLGTEGRFYFIDTMEPGTSPGIKTTFVGTLLQWKYLDRDLAKSLEKQYKTQWQESIDTDAAYIILGNQQPDGCP